MKVEVFKLYDSGNKLFDSIIESNYITWRFDSKNRRDFDPHINDLTPGPQAKDTVYLDGNMGEYDLVSTIKNIVLKYDTPVFLKDKSKYTNFYKFEGSDLVEFPMEFYVSDKLGLDNEVVEIGFNWNDTTHTSSDGKVLYSQRRDFVNDDGRPIKDEIAGNFEPYLSSEFFVDSFSTQIDSITNTLTKITFKIKMAGNYLKEVHNDLIEGKYTAFTYLDKLYVKMYDLAGNEVVLFGNKPLIPIPYTMDKFVELLQRLTLTFYDTYPVNLFLDQDVIGNTTAFLENPNVEFTKKFGLDTVLTLEKESLGYLVDGTRKESGREEGDDVIIITQDIDGIDAVGYVIADAWLKGDIFDDEINSVIRNHTFVWAKLGEFIKECIENRRKLSVEPFLPEFTKGTLFHDFCKLLEHFLNTEYTPLEKSCRIGLLEKIKRIGDFNDIGEIEFPAVKYYADNRGSELDFDLEAFNGIRDMSKRYNNFDFDTKQLVRDMYRLLPYVNRYKGAITCFNILYRALGLNVELIPLWGKKGESEGDTEFVEEIFADDTYWLSSHIILKVNGYLAYDLAEIATAIYRLARSILPVIRVIDYLLIEEFSSSANYLKLGYVGKTHDLSDNTLKHIIFLWNKKDISVHYGKSQTIVKIPVFAEKCFFADNTAPAPATNNCIHYFSRFANTVKTHTLKMAFEFPKSKNGNNEIRGMDDLKPFTDGRMDFTKLTWENNHLYLYCKGDNSALAGLNTGDFLMVTFVYRDTSLNLCYPITLKELLNRNDKDLPGWYPLSL